MIRTVIFVCHFVNLYLAAILILHVTTAESWPEIDCDVRLLLVLSLVSILLSGWHGIHMAHTIVAANVTPGTRQRYVPI